MSSQHRTGKAEQEIPTILQTLHQEFQRQIGKEHRALLVSTFQSIQAAVAREETAIETVTWAWSHIREGEENLQALFLVNDTCAVIIKELFLAATQWQRIGNDLSAYACFTDQCLQQRDRVIKLALNMMDQQLEALRRLNTNGGVPITQPGVPSAPDRQRDSLTVVEAITASHIFTLVFPGKAIAVLHIHGPLSLDEARTHASSALPHASYEVVDGDETHGHVAPFHAWTSALSQSALSLREAQEREGVHRMVRRIRTQIKEKALCAWKSAEWQEGQQKTIGHLRHVPAEARAAFLSGLTETELALMCDEIDAVIYALTTMDVARLTYQEREAHVREARAIEDALELEQMRRLVAKDRTREMKAQGKLTAGEESDEHGRKPGSNPRADYTAI